MKKSGVVSAKRYGLTVSESRMANLGASRDGKSPLDTTAITTSRGRRPAVTGERVQEKQCVAPLPVPVEVA